MSSPFDTPFADEEQHGPFDVRELERLERLDGENVAHVPRFIRTAARAKTSRRKDMLNDEVFFSDEASDELEWSSTEETNDTIFSAYSDDGSDQHMEAPFLDAEDDDSFGDEFEQFDKTVPDEFTDSFMGEDYELHPTDAQDEFVENESGINVRRAISRNRRWGRKLKWRHHFWKIRKFLMASQNLPSISTAKQLALAVADWQRDSGGMKVDGIIGPTTWKKLQASMAQRKSVGKLPQVSPSQVSPNAVPNAQKSFFQLGMEIYEAEFITLDAWESALFQFSEVIKAAADSEGVAQFGQVLSKLIQEKFLSTLTSQAKGVSAVIGVLDKLSAEHARAEKARDSAQLRDFIVRFSRTISDRKIALSSAKADYFAILENQSKTLSVEGRAAYKKRLVAYANRLDQNRAHGLLTGASIFRLIAFEWIRNTESRFFKKRSSLKESLVTVKVNRTGNIHDAKIIAPGGKKIAEQLLKDAQGAGVRPYEWPVRRMIFYYDKSVSSRPMYRARSLLTASGRQDYRNSAGDENDHRGEASIRFKRLLSRRPATRKLSGR